VDSRSRGEEEVDGRTKGKLPLLALLTKDAGSLCLCLWVCGSGCVLNRSSGCSRRQTCLELGLAMMLSRAYGGESGMHFG